MTSLYSNIVLAQLKSLLRLMGVDQGLKVVESIVCIHHTGPRLEHYSYTTYFLPARVAADALFGASSGLTAWNPSPLNPRPVESIWNSAPRFDMLTSVTLRQQHQGSWRLLNRNQRGRRTPWSALRSKIKLIKSENYGDPVSNLWWCCASCCFVLFRRKKTRFELSRAVRCQLQRKSYAIRCY